MRNWWKALTLGAVAIGGPAYAQASPDGAGWGHGGGMMRMADANGDGVVTRAEYQASVDQRFARMDANGDGILTPDERPRHGPRHSADGGTPASPPPASAPDRADMASDAPMTRDQFRAAAMRRFDAMDSNHDGRIDATEMQAMAGRWHGGGNTPPPPPPPPSAATPTDGQ